MFSLLYSCLPSTILDGDCSYKLYNEDGRTATAAELNAIYYKKTAETKYEGLKEQSLYYWGTGTDLDRIGLCNLEMLEFENDSQGEIKDE